ncbi:hypothetical protein Sste5346_006947 [Sporothrix stenoceras]|uniref:Something about silencing protein 4 domain-containing protein n=1 Tax=Sporothrix stenoceras TaxID=5173 RepID=A0ABR3YXM5_9PEZI
MLETLTILPMAPGTRSRRADVLHRATPVLLPKPKQRQTTLDQHLHSVGARTGSAATRPPPALQQPLQQPRQRAPRQAQQQQQNSRQQQKRQQSQTQLQASQPQQQQLSFAIAAPPRSIQNILNHANSMGSMSAARPKRKSAADADETLRGDTNGHAGASSNRSDPNSSLTIADTEDDDSDNALDSALRKRPRLAVEIVDYAKTSPGLQSPPGALAPLPPPNRAGAATKTKTNTNTTNTAGCSGSLAAAIPIAPPPTTTNPHTSTSSTASTHTLTRPIAARQHHTTTPATHQTTVRDIATRDKAASSTTTAPSTHTSAPAAPSQVPLPSSDAARSHRPSGRPPSKTTSQLAATTAKPSKEKEKAVNGFKNQELKALQISTAEAEAVAAAATRGAHEGGRKLRSQEATRFKSELAAYFPDYDEVIGNEPKEEHLLNIDTPIIFVESTPAHPATNSATATISTPLAASLRSSDRAGSIRVKGYGDKLFYDVFDSHVLDFTFLGNQHKSKGAVDPLPDSLFEVHHKRAERLERSIRNTEKGRAQHEKDQIIRLLEGLQGPDWLRTMGVSGITESKKKTFEPAREHFIRGCRAILEKFRLWSLEEKRRKIEKDRAHAQEVKAREAAAEAAAAHPRGKGKAKADDPAPKSSKRRNVGGKTAGKRATRKSLDDSDVVDEQDDEVDDSAEAAEDEDDEAGDEDEVDDDSQPDSSDFDAVIAQQLREEALARSRLASKAAASTANKRRKTNRAATKQGSPPSPASSSSQNAAAPPSPSQAPEEVTSFFRKRYQREAALSRGRRKGRNVMAWGQPVPEPPETEFNLPGDILSRGGAAGRGMRGSGGAAWGRPATAAARGGARGVARK